MFAQHFFDVESVLFGGAIGSTNTAMTISGFLLGLILITLIVLVRRAKGIDDEDWIGDEFDDDDYDEYEEDDYEEDDYEEEVIETESQINENANPVISDSDKKKLAAQAASLGVMQAVPGTVQGSSGWYVDISEEVQYWNVNPDGSWVRIS